METRSSVPSLIDSAARGNEQNQRHVSHGVDIHDNDLTNKSGQFLFQTHPKYVTGWQEFSFLNSSHCSSIGKWSLAMGITMYKASNLHASSLEQPLIPRSFT